MSNRAFTGGVRPGGLTTSTEIRILLCYLLKSIGTPLTRQEIENALLGEELVNYFELSDALDKLCALGHLKLEDGAYQVTASGSDLADTLEGEVPRSVRESAVNAVLTAQQYKRKQAQHKAEVTRTTDGWQVRCTIEDLGEQVFSFELYLPDELTANAVKEKFIADGDTVFRCMLGLLTDNRQLLSDLLK
ncbi:DUF4364 family protein [Anaerofilum sp. BX8]|uniref:DUF4364 family protein n=1 Tax=Anaerofilum hominis TaxID=2763016 RepID=A0A923L1D7_9FIRM|nr:DUF4364 family protein [Anaerofilum hominis]MBC5582095.1 DUF4364 family protein [Anaerofilum hominis]